MKKHRSNKQGFTLVELMVVAIIVAILAAVAIPLMTANKKRAIATEAEAGCGTIRTALRIHYAEHSSYPTGSVAAAVTLTGIGDGDLDGTYFSEECYTYSSDETTFTVEADGSSSVLATSPKADQAAGIVITLTHRGEWTREGL